MIEALKALLASKKFVMAILGMVAMAAAKLGFELDTEAAFVIVSPLLTAILGQGIADQGKGAAQVAPPPAPPVQVNQPVVEVK